MFNDHKCRTLARIDQNVQTILQFVSLINLKEGSIVSTLSDLQAADAAIKAAVAAAITLIQSLHMGAGTVSDADVEAVVADLNAAATALGAAAPQP